MLGAGDAAASGRMSKARNNVGAARMGLVPEPDGVFYWVRPVAASGPLGRSAPKTRRRSVQTATATARKPGAPTTTKNGEVMIMETKSVEVRLSHMVHDIAMTTVNHAMTHA